MIPVPAGDHPLTSRGYADGLVPQDKLSAIAAVRDKFGCHFPSAYVALRAGTYMREVASDWNRRDDLCQWHGAAWFTGTELRYMIEEESDLWRMALRSIMWWNKRQ